MKKSRSFYTAVAFTLLAVVGLLVGLGFMGKWIAFLTIAILTVLTIVFLSDLPSIQKRLR